MFNCVKVIKDGQLFCIVHTQDQADLIIRMYREVFPHHSVTWFRDWAYIEGLGF